MDDLFDALEQGSTATVVASGVEWHIRRITSSDLLEHQVAALVGVDLEEAQRDPASLGRKARTDPQMAKRLARVAESKVCASVYAYRVIGDDGPEGDPKPVSFVLDVGRRDKAKRRAWVGDLDRETVHVIADAIDELCSGEVGQMLRAFRGRASESASA